MCSVEGQYDWDYLTFTQTWPPTFCKFNKCNIPHNITGWTIHGLWPSSSTGKDPFDCSGAPEFNIDIIKPIYSKLIVNWANLLNFNEPLDFWKHEWNKHGTCCLSDSAFPNELSYFTNALRLKNASSLESVLLHGNIIPSLDRTYTTDDVNSAIQEALNVTPNLECVNIQGQWYLDAIEICVDKNLNFENCSKHRRPEKRLKTLVHEIFRNIYRTILNKSGKEMKPSNQRCGNHAFLITP